MTFPDSIEQIVAAYPLAAFGAVFLAGVLSSAWFCVLAAIPLATGLVEAVVKAEGGGQLPGLDQANQRGDRRCRRRLVHLGGVLKVVNFE